jgi:hypothetical protein
MPRCGASIKCVATRSLRNSTLGEEPVKTFLVLVSKNGQLDPSLLARVPALASRALPFRDMPYRAETWQCPGGRATVFAWSNELAPDDAPLIHSDDAAAVTIAGYISHPAVANPWDVTCVATAIRLNDETVSRLGGVFAILHANQDGVVRVWKSASRTAPVYWSDGPGYYAVGTRALLLAFLLAGSPRPVYRPESLVPFLGTGRCAGEEAPFRDVRALEPNTCSQFSRLGVTVHPIDDFERTWGALDPTPADYDVLADLLVASVRPLGATKVVCSLSGGLDSRLVAAALHYAGIDFTTQTAGLPDSPDLLAARSVAAALRVPHEGVPAPVTEIDGRLVVPVDPLDRASRGLFDSDGMFFAENLIPGKSFNSSYVQTGGHGGERALRRSYQVDRLVSWADASRVLSDHYVSTPAMFEPEPLARFGDFLIGWLATERDLGRHPNGALSRLRLHYDLGTDCMAPIVMEVGRRGWQPYLDNQVMKAGAQIHEPARVGDEPTYQLLARLAPPLTELPFANSRWNFEQAGPLPGDEAGWERRAPIPAPAGRRRDFTWREHWTRELYETFYEQIFGDSRTAALFQVLKRAAFEAWFQRQRGNERPHRHATKLAWTAYSASVLLSNAWLEPDVSDRTIEVPVSLQSEPPSAT